MVPDAIAVRAQYYQQFDADYSLDVPGEGFGGWQTGEVAISAAHTAVVAMHAWDCGTREQYPGVWRSCEYLARSEQVSRTVFPALLAAVRRSPLPLFHVVGPGDYFHTYPGYARTVALAGTPPPAPKQVISDPLLAALGQFRAEHVWRGAHNNADGPRLMTDQLDFLPEAIPVGDEPIAEDSHQLLALCLEGGINHLVYTGFCADMCLLLSPGGMIDMSRHGVMCSAVREAVTSVENRETARQELAKEVALWRVSVVFGFVFSADDLVAALGRAAESAP